MKKLTLLALAVYIFYFLFYTHTTDVYQVKPGATIHSIATDLFNTGVIQSKIGITLLAKIRNTQPKIGYYDFKNIWQFLTDIELGKVKTGLITLIPGKTLAQYYQLLKEHPFITTKLSLPQILNTLGIPLPAEGRFLPQTYQFNYGDSAKSILSRSYHLMQKTLKNVWNTRDVNRFITNKYELLILASIIEKESGNTAEMKKISGVFINRLRNNMRLQTDPTVIYALEHAGVKYSGKLYKKDLKIKSPYNTYRIKGLPIGAITNPSLQSIIAAAHPQTHDFFYFVAKNTTSSAFAKTYAQHRKNINKYLKNNSL